MKTCGGADHCIDLAKRKQREVCVNEYIFLSFFIDLNFRHFDSSFKKNKAQQANDVSSSFIMDVGEGVSSLFIMDVGKGVSSLFIMDVGRSVPYIT